MRKKYATAAEWRADIFNWDPDFGLNGEVMPNEFAIANLDAFIARVGEPPESFGDYGQGAVGRYRWGDKQLSVLANNNGKTYFHSHHHGKCHTAILTEAEALDVVRAAFTRPASDEEMAEILGDADLMRDIEEADQATAEDMTWGDDL